MWVLTAKDTLNVPLYSGMPKHTDEMVHISVFYLDIYQGKRRGYVNNAGYKTHTLKKKVAPKDKGFAVKSQQNHICLQQKSHSVPGNNSEKRLTFTQRVAMVTRGKKSYLMFNQ